MNCLHSFSTKKKLELHKRTCQNFCNIIVPFDDTEILKFNQYQKSDKAPLVIYAGVYNKKD